MQHVNSYIESCVRAAVDFPHLPLYLSLSLGEAEKKVNNRIAGSRVSTIAAVATTATVYLSANT